MEGKTGVFLVAAAQDAAGAARLKAPCVRLHYRIAPGGMLQRAQTPFSGKGGLLGVYEAAGLAEIRPEKLARDLQAECGKRGFSGVVLDLEPQGEGEEQLEALCAALARAHVAHFVPERSAPLAPESSVICSAAVSGGSFGELVEELCQRYGPRRVCLDLVRMCSDFTMPSYSPDGSPLSWQELEALRDKYQAEGFFSPELCAKYFTYRKENGSAHFVLFDDGDTALQKLRIAREKSVGSVFFLFSEWHDEAKNIFASL